MRLFHGGAIGHHVNLEWSASERGLRIEMLREFPIERDIMAVGIAVDRDHIGGILNKAFEGPLALPCAPFDGVEFRDLGFQAGARLVGLAPVTHTHFPAANGDSDRDYEREPLRRSYRPVQRQPGERPRTDHAEPAEPAATAIADYRVHYQDRHEQLEEYLDIAGALIDYRAGQDQQSPHDQRHPAPAKLQPARTKDRQQGHAEQRIKQGKPH